MSSLDKGDDSDMGISKEQVAPNEAAPVVKTTSRIQIVDGKPVFKPTREFFLAFSALMTIALAVAFDATSLSVALPIISEALGGTALEAFWSGTSFLLASTVLQPTITGLSHIFGRKYLIYIALAFFAAGSIAAAVANNFTVILVGRTIQGIGGGGLLALTEVVVTDLVPLAFRATWFSLLSAMWSIGTVTGPLIGAGFAQNITWRWIFWINLPIIGVGLILVILFLNQAEIPGGIPAKLRRFDWIGSVLFTASATAFLFGLTTGGVMYEWSSFRVILPLIVGVVGLVGFAVYELKVASEPLIDKRIFANRDMVVTYVMTVLHGAILWTLVYFLTLYYQAIKSYYPITSAVAVLPETLTVAPAGMLVGIVAGITQRYRWSVWVGWVLTTLGAGLLLLLGPDSTVPQWIFLNIPIGIGTGMLFPAMNIAIVAACAPALNAQAAAFFAFLRTFGQAVGVAVAGVIFQNVFRSRLAALPAFAPVADVFSRDATIVVSIINSMPAGEDRSALVVAYNDSLRMIWVALLAFSASCLVLSVLIKGYTMNQEHVTDQALVQGERKSDEKREPEP